jgi:hypothetical protein
MGWYPVSEIKIIRNYTPREIIVTWTDAILGAKEKRFAFDQEKEAMEFATKEFNLLAM